MSELSGEITKSYFSALKSYLEDRDESRLGEARRIGENAISGGLSLGVLLKIHSDALTVLTGPSIEAAEGSEIVEASERFLAAVLAPYDGFWEKMQTANSRLQQLNEALEDQAVELAATNRELKKEISDREWAEEALIKETSFVELLEVVATAANKAAKIDDAIQIALKKISSLTDWPIGHAYFSVEGFPQGRAFHLWHFEDAARFSRFRRVTENANILHQADLPGRVLFTKAPAWFHDLVLEPDFERIDILKESGVKAGFAFPILIGSQVAGVIEFFSSNGAEPDDLLMEVMGHIGEQLGRVIERQRAEEALRRSEERYRHFFEEDLTADFIADAKGDIDACNSSFARIFGFTSCEESVGINLTELFPTPESWPSVFTLLRNKRKLQSFDMEMVRRDGNPVHVVGNVIGDFDDDGRLKEIKGYLIDTTERKRLEERLRRAQKMESLGALADGISHDFNNILAIVLGYATLISESQEAKKSSQWIEAIPQAAQRGVALVQQLLMFAPKGEIRSASIDPGAFIEEFGKLLSETFPENIHISLQTDESLPFVEADPGQLRQALLNLGIFSRDMMVEGGTLTLSPGPADFEVLKKTFPEAEERKYLKISLADTGPGLDEETRARIFDPFFTLKDDEKKSGLGLAVVYGIVRNHKGFIDVESEPGHGMIFHLYLPATERANVEAFQSRDSSQISGGHERILLVEDEEALLNWLKMVLEEKGYQVFSARDGQEAVEVYNRHKDEIDLVILDLGLPKMPGPEAFRRMKHDQPNVNVIVASGYLDPEVQRRLLKEGAKKIIQKPYLPNEILKRIRETIDNVN